MNDKQNEIADFLLGQFEDGCASKDDLHYKMQERYNYDVVPFYVLERLKDEGLVKDLGEAYYMLSKLGEKAARNGYNKQRKRQDRLDYVKEYKEYINIICTGITIISMVIAIVANLM